MEELREKAKQWATEALLFNETLTQMIHTSIDEMPLPWVGRPYCPACESVLCGVCGECHSHDLHINDSDCPNDHDTMGRDCFVWWQALKSVITAQQMEEDD